MKSRRTLFSRKTHVHPPLAEIQSLGFQTLNKLLGRFFHAGLRRDVDGEPWLPFVSSLVVEALFSLIQTQEDYLRKIEGRIVLRNRLFFSMMEGIFANDWFHICELAMC